MKHICKTYALAVIGVIGLAIAVPGICYAGGLGEPQGLSNNNSGGLQVRANGQTGGKQTQLDATDRPAQTQSNQAQSNQAQSNQAQSNQAQSNQPQELQAVQVIGSLIQRPALQGNAAVKVISGEQLTLNGTMSIDQ